ncbi:Der1-like family-domain-containing protein [Zychaea mexicana]|uniref:Der1-like family-domain-containing protein n=1 Tax=Zychaea mexicana TaxID=64656 RepID=UPI0022FEB67B|nr:Der1-like family-domain-containing protein [Zychaea mexicana]KAI9479502.1 Der1-like family-domain-containing protein [Zychaea mexicana]
MPPQAGQARNELLDWYQSIPPITKAIFTLSIVTTVAPALGLVSPFQLILNWNAITKLQLWRLISSFFLHKLDLGFAMNLYFAYRQSLQLENEVFAGRTADYLYFLLVTSIMQLAAARYLDLYVLSDGLMMTLTYLWSRHYRDVPMTFMFGIRFKAQYLPWVLVGYSYLTPGGSVVGSLVGIAAAHIYYYLTTTYPSQGGRRYLSTPAFLQRLFPQTTARGGFTAGGGFQMWPGNQQQQQQQQPQRTNVFGGHSWGRGQRLGT